MSLPISFQSALRVRPRPSHCCFEFGEYLLDRVEVRRVGRQVAHAGADRLNCLPHAIDLVGAQIVLEDEIALLQVGMRTCST